MPARHFSSVDLPEPLRPTIPKNSPGLDRERDVAQRAQLVVPGAAKRVQRTLLERVNLLARDLNVFETPSTTTAGGEGTATG